MTEFLPLILTARMDDPAFAYFDALRRQHFPRKLNVLAAHVTLFHKLPGNDEPAVIELVRQACEARTVITAKAENLRFLGRGVAINIASPGLATLRADIARQFHDTLSPQDKQPFRPHVTIQNKVDAETARTLHARLVEEFTPFSIQITGLVLWRYLGGPWEMLGEFGLSEPS